MPAIVTALVGFLVLSNTVVAPTYAQTKETTDATTTTAVVALKTANARARITPSDSGTALTVNMTSYNAVPAQTDANPLVTASGAYSNPEVIAARSVDLADTLPYGTIVSVERTAADSSRCHFSAVESQIGYRVIADSMNSRWTNRVDVLLDASDTVSIAGKSFNPSIALGICGKVAIKVVGYVDPRHIPSTQEELAKLVSQGRELAIK